MGRPNVLGSGYWTRRDTWARIRANRSGRGRDWRRSRWRGIRRVLLTSPGAAPSRREALWPMVHYQVTRDTPPPVDAELARLVGGRRLAARVMRCSFEVMVTTYAARPDDVREVSGLPPGVVAHEGQLKAYRMGFRIDDEEAEAMDDAELLADVLVNVRRARLAIGKLIGAYVMVRPEWVMNMGVATIMGEPKHMAEWVGETGTRLTITAGGYRRGRG